MITTVNELGKLFLQEPGERGVEAGRVTDDSTLIANEMELVVAGGSRDRNLRGDI